MTELLTSSQTASSIAITPGNLAAGAALWALRILRWGVRLDSAGSQSKRRDNDCFL